MPNRQGPRQQDEPLFEAFGQPVCTYKTCLDPEVPGEPAHHTFSSVLWQVTEGNGWVVYEQKYSGIWTLAYLWPGISWGASVDLNYFFLPVTPMLCEVTCFAEQTCLDEMIFDGEFPIDVCVYLRGTITKIDKDWIALTNQYATSRVALTDQETQQINDLQVGKYQKLVDEIELDVFLASLQDNKHFDPRIIYPYRETAGSELCSDCEAYLLEEAATSSNKAGNLS